VPVAQAQQIADHRHDRRRPGERQPRHVPRLRSGFST
jgi:hypothetical protein